ncbi:cell surface protein [Lacrimispora amygdalina]|uniref:Cell surface protein n=1 Tax=Lacrimispora amygdalina TaxID=253257 RepID=A0ABQ5M8L8_9FIRM
MKRYKFLTALFMMTLVFCSTSTVAFAGGGEEYEYKYEETVIAEETVEPALPLTPDGNLTLVDDITTNEESSKQFITAVTKNGNYFYLVIDRADDKDNVYLLNMVDEADLMALMEGEPVPMPKPEEPQPTPTEPTEEEPVKEETEKPKNNTLPLLMLVLAMCGGGAFYYLKFVKGKNNHKGSTNLNELNDDYSDDNDEEEYELDDEDSYLADKEE